MVDSANEVTAIMSKTSPQPKRVFLKAIRVISMPLVSASRCAPLMRITSAVSVHTTMVSMKGPSMATKPSCTGSSVLDWPWYMGAEPSPASFENMARRAPRMMTPHNPPETAVLRLKASLKMRPKEGPIASKFINNTAATASR